MTKFINKFVRIAAAIFLTGNLVGCYTIRVASEISHVGIEAKAQAKGESLGAVRAKDCAFRVAGFGPSPNLMRTLENVKRKYPKISYIKNFRLDRTQKNYVFWATDCWEIAGFGYL